jgi:hypothetical protein
MVYDEGFEFNLGKKDTPKFSSYFSFLKFSLNDKSNPLINSKYFSHCYEALIGWFHTDDKKWGCFYGYKLNVKLSETNGEASDKLLVVENVIKPAFIEKEIKIKEIEQKIQNQNDIDEQNNLTNNLNYNFEIGRFMQTEFRLNNKMKMKLGNRFRIKTSSSTRIKSNSILTLDSEFTNHEEVVNRINSMNLGWKAEFYTEFKGKTIADINKFSGRSGKGKNMVNVNNMLRYEEMEMKNRKIKNNFRVDQNKSSNFLLIFINFIIINLFI